MKSKTRFVLCKQMTRSGFAALRMTVAALVVGILISGNVAVAEDFDQLVSKLHDSDEEVRAAACKALGAANNPKAIAELEKKLRDPSPTVQAEAADALIKIGGSEAQNVFECLAQSGNTDFRQIGIIGLAKVGLTENVTDALLENLTHPNARVRWSAAFALGIYRDGRALAALEKVASSDTNEEVRACATEAIRQIKSGARWRRNIEAGYREARELNKPVMLFFTARRSDWCESFEESVLGDPAVADMMDKFVCIRQNIEGQIELIRQHEIRGVPTTIFTDNRGNEIARLVGYTNKDAVLETMAEANRGRSSFRETRRRALENPDDADANWRTAEVYLAEDRLALAVGHLKRIIGKDPQNRRGYTANAMFALGFAQGKLGQHKDACEALTRFLKEYPAHKDRDRAMYCLALSQLGLGQKEGARETLDTLLRQFPDSAVAKPARMVLEKINAEQK